MLQRSAPGVMATEVGDELAVGKIARFANGWGPSHLQVEGLSVAYDGQAVLCDVTFDVPEGTRLAVVGPNGSGKSTLFKAIVGLVPTQAGRVLIHGLPWIRHQDCVAYVPQREELDWRFPVSVLDVVLMGRYGQIGWVRRAGKADRAIALHCLEQMGTANLAHHPIGELSGGQQQRVFLARALAQEPHILLMDEPFTGVDASTQEAALRLVGDLQAQGVTTIVSTHDLSLAATRFDLILLLNHRVIAFGTAANTLTREALREAFGGQVLFVEGAAVVDQCCPADEEQPGGVRR